MIRQLSLTAAALVSAALLAPVAAEAASTGTYYSATPIATPAKPLLITSGTVWKWTDTAYTADQAPQRESIMCELVVKSAGKLSAFTAGGTAFDAAALAKCNARAK